jgi:hypothetical protein
MRMSMCSSDTAMTSRIIHQADWGCIPSVRAICQTTAMNAAVATTSDARDMRPELSTLEHYRPAARDNGDQLLDVVDALVARLPGGLGGAR